MGFCAAVYGKFVEKGRHPDVDTVCCCNGTYLRNDGGGNRECKSGFDPCTDGDFAGGYLSGGKGAEDEI